MPGSTRHGYEYLSRRLGALAHGWALQNTDWRPSAWAGVMRGIPIIAPERLPDHLGSGTVVLAAVASRGARDLIRTRLVELGLEEGRSFWCVA